jgi:hypothetical protein
VNPCGFFLLHKEQSTIREICSVLGGLILLAAAVAIPRTSNAQEIFSDGFETGDTVRWSAQYPVVESVNGTYQFSVYDSLSFASGGNLVIADSIVVDINGTYFNYDKVDIGGEAQCTLIFLWGVGLDPTDVEGFELGVEFSDIYPGGGEMAWTLTFSIFDNIGFSGTLEAEGANFTGVDSGCNGTFPELTIEGGKRNPRSP